MSAAASPPWVTDVGRLCERLAARLADEGARHPATAAVALIARGERGLPASSFAVEIGVALADVAAAERGDIALTELPAPLLRAARDLAGVELARVLDLDTAASRSRHPAQRE